MNVDSDARRYKNLHVWDRANIEVSFLRAVGQVHLQTWKPLVVSWRW